MLLFISQFFTYSLGLITGLILFWLTNNSRIKNLLTREFTVKLRFSHFREEEGQLKEYVMHYEIRCSLPEDILIIFGFIKLPKDVYGNKKSHSTLTEMIEPENGKLYILENVEMKKYHFNEYRITQRKVLDCIQSGKIKSLRLNINTNKYGNVKSNKIKIPKTK